MPTPDIGTAGNLAATMPKPGQSWQAAGFEAIITFSPVRPSWPQRGQAEGHPAGRGGPETGVSWR